jgi:hypothetical protein
VAAQCGMNLRPFGLNTLGAVSSADGRYWARTSDPLLVRQVLSQLS